MNSLVYETPVSSVEDLIVRNSVSATRIGNMLGIFEYVRNSTQRRCQPFQTTSGHNFEHLDEAHFWLNGYVNKQNCRIWSEANPQVYVETPLHPEKLTV
ncbi:hypothetical protein TNCV_4878391 [Trichonephila clavipes]|nr:hypothetical protein TNCV_4878391 [Trichonephila clavipes]